MFFHISYYIKVIYLNACNLCINIANLRAEHQAGVARDTFWAVAFSGGQVLANYRHGDSREQSGGEHRTDTRDKRPHDHHLTLDLHQIDTGLCSIGN